MKVISIGTDRKVFEEGSAVRRRNAEYGKFFEETHVIVFSTRNSKYSNSKYQISENVFAYPTNSVSKLFYIWDAFRISKAICHKLKASNCVVSAGDSFETGMVGVLTKLFLGLPLHVQVHTDLMHEYFRSLSVLNKSRFFVSEFILRYADRIRVVSERIKKSIQQFSKNIDVLPIKNEIKDNAEKEMKKPFPFTLLMVCRLEKEKNIEMVLQVIKNLENNGIGLCLVGDGSQRENLECMAKDLNLTSRVGISDRVVFVGWQNDLEKYYQEADIYISTSFYEGYGVSTMEAAYFGKPLILSDTGVAGEIFKYGESALICDAKDENCFTENILKIYKDKNLAERMGQSAKIAADKHLDSKKNYFEEYAESIIKTANNFKKRNFLSRIFDFKKTAFNSFLALRYFVCGITATTVNLFSLYIFTDIVGIWYLYSSILAFLIALVISFTLQKFVVFKDMNTGKMHHQFSKFFMAAVLGVLTNTILIFVCVDIFGIWYIFSQVIAGFFVMIQNFILYKIFIFNNKK